MITAAAAYTSRRNCASTLRVKVSWPVVITSAPARGRERQIPFVVHPLNRLRIRAPGRSVPHPGFQNAKHQALRLFRCFFLPSHLGCEACRYVVLPRPVPGQRVGAIIPSSVFLQDQTICDVGHGRVAFNFRNQHVRTFQSARQLPPQIPIPPSAQTLPTAAL